MSQSADSEIVADLAEEFIELHREGKRPGIDDFVRRYPHLEDEIRDLFPTLMVVENLAPEQDASVVGTGAERLCPPGTLESLGDFQILREVGRGGMGIVYEAEQVSLGRRVALKVLPHQQLSDTKQQARFKREARAAAKLHHTNIVPVFGVGEEAGTSYYVMQLIQGVGLNELIHQLRHTRNKVSRTGGNAAAEDEPVASSDATLPTKANSRLVLSFWQGEWWSPDADAANTQVRPSADQRSSKGDQEERSSRVGVHEAVKNGLSDSLSPSDESIPIVGPASSARLGRKPTYWDSVARIGLQVANALQYAHEHSILHRDIKPSNLLLDHSGTVWVTDFGLAKALDHKGLTNTGDILGTLRYMPPEVFKTKTDHRFDIYSLGITLYELLTLQPAFEESDPHRLVARLSEGPPERLERVDSAIPRDLVTIVHKAIEREPAHRYQSAKALEEDLTRFINGEPIAARRISAFERVIRWSQRNRAMSVAIASIATLLVLVTVVSTIAALQSSEAKQLAEANAVRLSDEMKLAESARAQTDEARFISNIQLASFYVQRRSAAQARRILKNIPPKHRNWEWAYLADNAWPYLAPAQTPAADTDDTSGIATAELWKNKVANRYQQIVAEYGGIRDGQFTADGSNVVLSALNGSMGLYSLADGAELHRFVNPDKDAPISRGRLSPDAPDCRLHGNASAVAPEEIESY